DGGHVDRLGAAAGQLLAERAGQLAGLAGRRHRRVVYLGSGALTGLAREAALKLLELTAGQVVSYWDSPLGFRHGPKAVLEQGTHCAAPSATSTSWRSPRKRPTTGPPGTSVTSATFPTRWSPCHTPSSPSNSRCSPRWSSVSPQTTRSRPASSAGSCAAWASTR